MQRPDDGLITPEAVVLDFSTGGVGSRGLAKFLDLIIQGLVLGLIAVASLIIESVAPIDSSWVGATVLILVTFLVLIAYGAIFEAMWNGRTPGKAALGLRVVTVEGAPVKFRHTAIRAALGIIEILATFGAIALMVSFLSRRDQRLGDMVAGTLVLRERTAESVPVATQFVPPPRAQDFAATLDVSTLDSQDYQVIRSFLLRAPGLRNETRSELAGQLGRQLVSKVSVSLPSDLDAEDFLLCLAAAYQRRFSS